MSEWHGFHDIEMLFTLVYLHLPTFWFILFAMIICKEGIRMKKSNCKELPPSELDLVLTCAHTKRCLLKSGISTLDQLMALSEDDLLQIRGIGQVITKDVLREREEYQRKWPDFWR